MSDPRLHFRKPLLTSPFHARTSALNKLNEWGPWGGYTTVLAYDDASMEYTAIRNQASVYDLSPMVKYRITGKDAVAYLDRVMIRNIAKLKLGHVQYTAWCDDEGKLLDDGTLFRHGETDFLLCCQERHLPWLLDSAIGYDVSVTEITEEIAALSLAGPLLLCRPEARGLRGGGQAQAVPARAIPLRGRRLTSPSRAPASPAISAMNCGRRPIARSICGICCSKPARSTAYGRSAPPRSTWRASKRASSSPTWISSPPNRPCAGPLALALRDGPRLDDRFRQGPFQRQARARRREGQGHFEMGIGRARYRRQCRGRAFAHLSQQETRGRPCDGGDLVADHQAQYRARHAGAALSRCEARTICGSRSMPCASSSITSSWFGHG